MRRLITVLPVVVVFLGQPTRNALAAGAAGGSSPLTTVADKPAENIVSVEEAISLADAALARLETGDESDLVEVILDEVESYIDLVRRNEPNNPWLPYLLGRAYMHRGRAGDSVDALRKFVETATGRNEWRAYYILGELFVGEFPRLAQANYTRAAALNPREPRVLAGLSTCAAKRGAVEEAIRLARDAITADGSQNVRYISHLARLLRAVSRWDEAFPEAGRALELARKQVEENPGVPRPLLVLNAQYELMIDVIEARLAESEARATGADTGLGHDGIEDRLRLASYIREAAATTHMLARHDALAVLEDGVNLSSPNPPPSLLEQYAIALVEVGRTESAIAVFEDLLEADPKSALAAEWLGRLRPRPVGAGSPRQP